MRLPCVYKMGARTLSLKTLRERFERQEMREQDNSRSVNRSSVETCSWLPGETADA